jgi:hypothetical protein
MPNSTHPRFFQVCFHARADASDLAYIGIAQSPTAFQKSSASTTSACVIEQSVMLVVVVDSKLAHDPRSDCNG